MRKPFLLSEPNLSFLFMVDVSQVIEFYADFIRQGRAYTLFPDVLTHRVKLGELRAEPLRERLQSKA